MIFMEKKLRKLRILKRKRAKSFPDLENLCCVRLGSLEMTQSKSLEKAEEAEEEEDVSERKRIRPDRMRTEDSNLETDDLDNATAAMMAMFRNVSLDSECSSARSSIRSKYSIQFETETDDSDDEDGLGTDQIEAELRPNFPGDRRFSMCVGQNNESRYH